jgi:hypothetical protein
MGDTVTIIEDEPKTVERETIIVKQPEAKTEKKETVTEHTVVRETRD